MGMIDDLNKPLLKTEIPSFSVGDRIKVHYKIVEGDKVRIQVFEGNVIRRKNRVNFKSMVTVRKNSYGVYVERFFPLHSPLIEKIELVRKGDVKRARLYYLRELRGKKAKIDEQARY